MPITKKFQQYQYKVVELYNNKAYEDKWNKEKEIKHNQTHKHQPN